MKIAPSLQLLTDTQLHRSMKKTSAADKEGRIRNHANRAGEADEGHEYEHVKKGDDESIDDDGSEVGWNSEDELAFQSTSTYQKKKSRKDESESEQSASDYDDDEEEGGMLLSDFLTNNINNAKNGVKPAESEEESEDEDSEEYSDDDDEGEGSGSEEDEGSDSDEDEDEIEDVHARLLDAIDRFAKPQASFSSTRSSHKVNNQNVKESVYSSVLDNGDVSMNALLGALDDTRGLGVIKKHLSDLEKGLAAPVHVEKVVADRMERTQIYAGTKDDMNKWQTTVVANRHVGTLDLAHDKRQVRSFKSMVHRFVPTTDMEKEVQMVLVKHGANDEDAEQREVDELQGRNMSLQEIREKQAELAKVKALMFYDQMKRHRLNKIKSKAYRKIQKRKKLKGEHGAADDLDAEELGEAREKDAYNRVKERMDLRHKNTSKWAKMAIQYGHTDKSLREAYHDSVQLGQELTQKMNEELQDETRSDGSASEPEDQQSGDEGLASKASARRAVSNRASRAIESLLNENLSSSAASSAVPEGRYKKLFEMDFMKRAADQQKESARLEAQSILREIENMEEQNDSELEEEEREARRKAQPQISQERLSQAKKEVKEMLDAGGSMVLPGRRKGQVMTDSINLGASSGAQSAARRDAFKFAEPDEEDEELDYSDAEEHAAMEKALESNPWLQPTVSATGSKKRKSSGTGAKTSVTEDAVYINTLALTGASSSAAQPAPKKSKNAVFTPAIITTTPVLTAPEKKKGKDAGKKGASSVIVETTAAAPALAADKEKPAVRISLSEGRTQADLVQMAFAGPDLEAEFRAFKKQEIDAEHGIDEKKMQILKDVKAGWGDWAGPGAGGMQISQKTLNKRDRLLTKVQNEHASKVLGRSDAKMHTVMISNRRVKTAAKYKITEIPHPYTSIEEYERSLQMPLGDEWNSSDVVKSNTQPEIKIRPGRIIEPVKLSKKRSVSAAGDTTRLNKPASSAKKTKK